MSTQALRRATMAHDQLKLEIEGLKSDPESLRQIRWLLQQTLLEVNLQILEATNQQRGRR